MTSGGWSHRRTLADRDVSVEPTSTLLLLVPENSGTSVSGVLTNESATESLSITWQTSFDGLANWADLFVLNTTQFSEPVAPQESRHFQFDTRDLKHVRLLGRASGSGLTAHIQVMFTAALR